VRPACSTSTGGWQSHSPRHHGAPLESTTVTCRSSHRERRPMPHRDCRQVEQCRRCWGSGCRSRCRGARGPASYAGSPTPARRRSSRRSRTSPRRRALSPDHGAGPHRSVSLPPICLTSLPPSGEGTVYQRQARAPAQRVIGRDPAARAEFPAGAANDDEIVDDEGSHGEAVPRRPVCRCHVPAKPYLWQASSATTCASSVAM
jgi:hypothetical protein